MLWETRPLGTVGLPMFSADGQHITLVAQEDRHPVIQVLDHIALFDHLDGAR